MANESPHDSDEQREVHRRLWLPILIPAIIFLFAVLVIYGLSRIYLELNRVEVGNVTLATPLALGVSLAILGIGVYLASRPSVPVWQYIGIGVVAALALTGGSIAAAVIEDEEHEEVVNGGGPTPPPPGSVAVELLDTLQINVTPDTEPAGPVTFLVKNVGSLHNFHVIQTDLPPDGLPTDGAQVALDQLTVVGETEDLSAGEEVTVETELQPGPYVLICNIAGHYQSGMHAAFTVGPPAAGGPPAGETTPPPSTGGGGGAGTVDAELLDSLKINVTPDTAPAGPVTFNVTNAGSFHNLTVIQTELAPDDLPKDGGEVLLDQLNVVGQTADLSQGQSETLSLNLQEGPYVLICSQPTHYGLGMRAAFTVGPPP
jgi:uncharacterized cupredoxin-like copper-binding protein